MILMGLPTAFDTQRRIIEARAELKLDDVKKDLRQEALRLRAQLAHAHMFGNSMSNIIAPKSRSDSQDAAITANYSNFDRNGRKRERQLCPHCKKFVMHRPENCWDLPENAGKRRQASERYTQAGRNSSQSESDTAIKSNGTN
jgi:hypothetical protein